MSRGEKPMQLLGFVILIGMLTLLLIAGMYLASTQKAPSRRPRPGGYGHADFFHTEGEGNPLYNLEKLAEMSPREHRRHAQRRQRQHKHKEGD